ncbi:cysteine desulfurase family protein, partial [Planctomycetota bacterium]|nr:cysteine desulfurase family protein [Planctomycetota bacterium]
MTTYADYAGGAPMRDEALEVYAKFAREQFANASAHHPMAYVAKRELEKCHKAAAEVLGVDAREIIFTSGGTEADVLALHGVMTASPKSELVVSAIEHHAVLHEADRWKAAGKVVHEAPVNADGVIDLEALRGLVNENTALVSVMYANNETGVIQPVKKVAEIAHAVGALFHCDAVQALGKMPVKPHEIGADLLSLASAKFAGPKGVGLLFNRMTNRIAPLIVGGAQEGNLRAGTENLSGIAAMVKAMQLADSEQSKWANVGQLRDRLESLLAEGLSDSIFLHGQNVARLANISSVSFRNIEGQALGIELGEQGFSVGLGSACAPGETDPSHVLAAMGVNWEDAQGVVRFSFGPTITEA